MKTMVIGADQLGNIPKVLQSHGFKLVSHVTGRERIAQRATQHLPRGLDLVVLLTDFLGHNVMKAYRQAAIEAGVRVVACRRSVSAIEQALGLSHSSKP
jgi:hypothetical protein